MSTVETLIACSMSRLSRPTYLYLLRSVRVSLGLLHQLARHSLSPSGEPIPAAASNRFPRLSSSSALNPTPPPAIFLTTNFTSSSHVEVLFLPSIDPSGCLVLDITNSIQLNSIHLSWRYGVNRSVAACLEVVLKNGLDIHRDVLLRGNPWPRPHQRPPETAG